MIIFAYGFLGASAAVFLEWRYATAQTFWHWRVLLPMALCNFVISFTVYNLIKHSENLILGLMVFSLSTLFLRTALTLTIQGHAVTHGTWLALGFLLAAQFAKFWR